MLKKYILLIIAGLLTCPIIWSQNDVKHEMSVWGAGGLSTLNYDTNVGNEKNEIGGAVGIGYSYNITKDWSIGSGIELTIHNTKYTLNEFSDSYNTNDGEYDFIFHTTMKNYEEKQNVAYLNIPIMATFQKPVIGRNNLYASAGFKFGIPMTKKMKVVNADFNNYGYYPEWENPIQDDPYFMGFGAFKSSDKKGKLDIKTSFMLSLEVGLKRPLTNNMALYTGLYFDCGLNDIKKNSDKRMIQYNTEFPSDYIHNSAISSHYSLDNDTRILVDNVRTIAVGVKVKLAFSI